MNLLDKESDWFRKESVETLDVALAKKTRLMVTPSCFVRGVNTQKARRNLIDHSTPPQTFSFLIGLGKTEKKGLDQGIITKKFQKRSKNSVSA